MLELSSAENDFAVEKEILIDDLSTRPTVTSDDGGSKEPAKQQIEINCTKGSEQRVKFEKFLTAKYDEMTNYLFNMQTQFVKEGNYDELPRRVPPITSNPKDETISKDGIALYDDCKDIPYRDFLYKLREVYNQPDYEKDMKETCQYALHYCIDGIRNSHIVAGSLPDDESSIYRMGFVCKNIPGSYKETASDGKQCVFIGLIIKPKDCSYYFDIDRTIASLR